MSALATPLAPPSDLPIWQRMRVWATAHATADLYQGLVPAAVPYFVLERNLSYSAASGLALAATFGSALPQLPIGMLADRRRVPWLGPVGLVLAAVGVGLAGVFAPYPLVFAMLLLSGLGVAMFHPPAGRDARVAAAHSASAMSVFAAGGSVGFFLAPALATPLLDGLGLSALVLFIPPAVLMAFVLSRHQSRQVAQVTASGVPVGTDRPRMFALLIAVEVARSCISFGINTFVALYWIKELGASSTLGGTALTLGLLGGIAGTLLGGRIGDRFGLTRTIQLGNAALIPAFGLLLLVRDPYVALICVTLLGLTANIPLAVLVKLGQDYLPSRPGTAAGVTLGLAVSAGGLFQPVLGVIADHHGPRGAFVTLAFMPLLAMALSAGLRPPR
ncbi:FSR family fosmidomycin resistance protein-like MFS transporter [Solirubrobacter pauli]|uniref:FSR family fosmidomycin resistance protein-like MFS transporter n=2 Tax=Solirubrobacter pauli TaxID=166793 RepID=A0A660LA38_9ACTN|nr:MFS transporter [Solirubrobacter pauli]RKQ91135.1 FSR family fosmidomycin resistance protein-like MFS transporter [Solirubrobacter pauli]